MFSRLLVSVLKASLSLLLINFMKHQAKEQALTVVCKQHNQKCVFVCLFRTCVNAFKIGCIRCRKEHAQHPNRLISINQFHAMLCKPIQYIENVTAFKLMNLKRKVQYIRSFRTDILDKELQLIQSNKNIKTTILGILEEHYQIRDVVSHLDQDVLASNFVQYSENLQKCKHFLAYNPVKGELVFNNEVIKTGRVVLEKCLQGSHELIDNIREYLVKIIEVLLANCAHDEDDEDIEFAQEGDDATAFNIFIKSRKDITENPNIRSKLENESFLEMFDEQKQAMTKEVDILEKEINTKSIILNRIKQNQVRNKQEQSSESTVKNGQCDSKIEKDCSVLDIMPEMQSEKNQLREENALLKHTNSSNDERQKINNLMLAEIKRQYQTLLRSHEQQILELRRLCKQKQQKIAELTISGKNVDAQNGVCAQQYQIQLSKQKEINHQLSNTIQNLQIKILDLNASLARQNAEYSDLCQKSIAAQSQTQKKRNQQEFQKLSNRIGNDQLSKKYNQANGKLTRLAEQLDKKQKQLLKEKKKYVETEKLVEKLRQNSTVVERQAQKLRQEYQNRQRYMRTELQKSQKEQETQRYKSRNQEERTKYLESKVKELNRELEVKNDIIRQKDKIIKEKQQSWQSKNSIVNSRLKELQNELKTSRINDNTPKSEDQSKKLKQTKQLLEMSIKKNQDLKDRNFDLEMELQTLKKEMQQSSKINQTAEKNSRQEIELQRNKRSNMFISEPLKIETVNSEEYISPKRENQGLKQRKMIINKEEKKQAYLQIKSIFKAVSEDMNVLQERLKQNNVIEKVYLKQLERKRNENKILKKEIEGFKVYGNCKQPNESKNEKEKEKEKNDTSPTNQSPVVTKADSQVYMTKKYAKLISK